MHGFFYPGEERSDSVQVEQEQNWIVHGDLEFSEDTIPDSKYLDYSECLWSRELETYQCFEYRCLQALSLTNNLPIRS